MKTCEHCGGEVGEDGMSLSIEPEEEKSGETELPESVSRDFLAALKESK